MRLLATAVLLATNLVWAEPDGGVSTYTLDAKRSELVVKTFKEGIGAGLAHNHVIAATELSGRVRFDPANLAAANITVSVKTGSLLVDDAKLREKHGEPKSVPDGDRTKIAENMKGDGQLNVAKFPTIEFASSGLAPASSGFVLTGQLTLHGVTKSISLPVKLTVEAGTVTGDGRLKVKLSDYGISPYSAALGAIRNADEVEFVLHLVGT